MKQLLTIDVLEEMPEDLNRYELIGGELHVSPRGEVTHQLILTDVVCRIHEYLLEHPIGRTVPQPGVIFSNYDSVVPDVVYVSE